jgi:hypothetical protein
VNTTFTVAPPIAPAIGTADAATRSATTGANRPLIIVATRAISPLAASAVACRATIDEMS